MKKAILDLNISQKAKKVEVSSWTKKAIGFKKSGSEPTTTFGKKLQMNMIICKSMLHKK